VLRFFKEAQASTGLNQLALVKNAERPRRSTEYRLISNGKRNRCKTKKRG